MIRRDSQPQKPSPASGPTQAPGEASRLGDLIERFAELAEATSEDRERHLAELAQREPGVAEALCRMLEAEASDGANALDGSPLDLAAALDGEPGTIAAMPSALPAVGGRYEIRRPLGFGSHGDVYLARQHEPVERDVAIKVLRPSQVNSSTSERMVREAGVLATLNHPGIATVHEAGQTDDCRPFIVTEFVDGSPIDRWCGEVAADGRTRCDVVARVCRAVEHMHQRGVIHRDLKPTNILVAGDASDPRPKLVDLGIARILRVDGVEAPPTLTQEGALLGSVGYIAPEQFAGAPADTRSDIFALGRVLHGLLKDAHDPWLAKREKDVHAIIRKATASEPGQRYASVGELGDDLAALLEGRPVSVRRQTPIETVVRWARRHPRPAVAVLVSVAAASIAGAIAVHQSVEREAALVAQMALLTQTLDGSVVALGRYGGTLDERDELAGQIETQLEAIRSLSPNDRDARILMSRVRTEQARIAQARGDLERAVDLATVAAAAMASEIDAESADVPRLRQLALAHITRGDALNAAKRHDEARDTYRLVLNLHRDARLRFPDDVRVLDDLGWSLDRFSQPLQSRLPPKAEEREPYAAHASERLALAQELLELDPGRFLSRFHVAVGYLKLGRIHNPHDLQSAVDMTHRAASMLADLAAEDPGRLSVHAYEGSAWVDLARIYARLGRTHEAMTAQECAVTAFINALGATPGSDAALSRSLRGQTRVLARMYADQDREADIPGLWRRVDAIAPPPGR